jgi:hypothetical protein
MSGTLLSDIKPCISPLSRYGPPGVVTSMTKPKAVKATIVAQAILRKQASRLVRLGGRCFSQYRELVHPVHREGRVFGWEILTLAS